MLRSALIVSSNVRRVIREWVANYTHLSKCARFRSRSMGTSIAELDDGGVMKGLIGVTAIALLLTACGRDAAKQQPGHGSDGAVGTSGRAPGTVSAVLRAEP